MQIKLERLPYQEAAIKSVVDVFDGNEKNTFDNACTDGIRANICSLSAQELMANIQSVVLKNGIPDDIAQLTNERELTIEMETGTGKTLVYIKSIYELFKHYGFTKFIILVPSVAIRQGVLNTLSTFKNQLEDIYGFTPKSFEYNSKKLHNVTRFIEEQHPQIMVMTLASFNSEDKILNQARRENLFADMPFIEAIGHTNPVIIMDEPQEGMDTENSTTQIAKLNPLFKIRYSATHKVVKNRLYRLSPYDSYRQALVKKIEVLTVTEKHDEATSKLELAEAENNKGTIRVKLKAWHQSKSGKFDFKSTKWLKVGANLGTATNNPSYLHYNVERINKNLNSGKWLVTFSNGTQISEKQTSLNMQDIWALQLEWLIIRHFTKKQELRKKDIKCLSFIFIDKVANYVGDNPVIKNLFIQKYKKIYPQFHDNQQVSEAQIEAVQGAYFAKTKKHEFTDNPTSMRKNKDVFDAILKDKAGLLRYGDMLANRIEFIFSHSALGVGWDNPNIFNIATLSHSYSDIKKRQEIGRGLRICLNTNGQRIYDTPDAIVNQLTVIPNESYETFVTQYQQEIKEAYGTPIAGAGMTHTHKGKKQNDIHFQRTKNRTVNEAFKRLWKVIAQKMDYTVTFDEQALISKSVRALNDIKIEDYVAEVTSHSITSISEKHIADTSSDKAHYRLKANYTPLDIVQEISEHTGLSHHTMTEIIAKINMQYIAKNPPQFIQQATTLIRGILSEEMLNGITYHRIEGQFPFDFPDFTRQLNDRQYINTPNKGVYNKMPVDKDIQSRFALSADTDDKVICLMKLPAHYSIPTPIGSYTPDFAMAVKRKNPQNGTEDERYIVIETKEKDSRKMDFAVKCFAALGVEVEEVK